MVEVERTLADGPMAVFRFKGTWKHSVIGINSIQPLKEVAALVVARFKDEHSVSTTGVTIGVESGVISGQ
jgi:hypothetical protein